MIYSLYHQFIALQQTGVLRIDLAIVIIEHGLNAYLMCDIGDRRGPDVFDFDLSVYAEMTQNEDHHQEKRDGHCKQYQFALVRHGNELQSKTACGAMPDTTYLLLLLFQFSEEQKEYRKEKADHLIGFKERERKEFLHGQQNHAYRQPGQGPRNAGHIRRHTIVGGK